MARFFTENDSKFLLLIHRLTPHDLGLSKSGKLRIENSENIVVVDTDDPDQGMYSSYRKRYRMTGRGGEVGRGEAPGHWPPLFDKLFFIGRVV